MTRRAEVWTYVVLILIGVSLTWGAGSRLCPEVGQQACAAETRPSSLLDNLASDPCIRCAQKALAGCYGPLEEWQRVGYLQAVGEGAVRRRAWITTYFPEEGNHRGDVCRWWGAGCSERVAAANRIPARAFVWANRTGIRQILDTGARSNDTRADRLGADLWVDYWEPKRGSLWGDDNAGVQDVWVIPRRG